MQLLCIKASVLSVITFVFSEVTKVRRNLFNQEMLSPSKRSLKRGLPRSHSVSVVDGLGDKVERKTKGTYRVGGLVLLLWGQHCSPCAWFSYFKLLFFLTVNPVFLSLNFLFFWSWFLPSTCHGFWSVLFLVVQHKGKLLIWDLSFLIRVLIAINSSLNTRIAGSILSFQNIFSLCFFYVSLVI